MTSVPTYPPSARGECAGCGKTVKRTERSAKVQYCRDCRRSGAAIGGCGTVSSYQAGCRCDQCRAAVAARVRSNLAKRRAAKDPSILDLPRCANEGCTYEAMSERVPLCRGCNIRHQHALVKQGLKRCPACGEILDVSSFGKARGGTGLRSKCRKCIASEAADWRSRNPGYGTEYMRRVSRSRGYARRARFGLTPEDVAQMHADQNGLCSICLKTLPIDALNVDHCHATGAIRSLLCRNCNLALGLLRDDPERMERAAAYVRRFATT